MTSNGSAKSTMSCHIPASLVGPKSSAHGSVRPDQWEQQHHAAKIARAMRAGPCQVTKDATIAEWNHDASLSILRVGTNEWVCFPGDENEFGNVPMACDSMGLQ